MADGRIALALVIWMGEWSISQLIDGALIVM
jgi:hypothetical protein